MENTYILRMDTNEDARAEALRSAIQHASAYKGRVHLPDEILRVARIYAEYINSGRS